MNVSSIRARLSALVVCFGAAVATPILAADTAHPKALGFSQDGTRFAFLEWGIQDGSGFPYANAYIVDLTNDAWLTRPIREVIENDTVPPRMAERQTRQALDPALDDHGITHPAKLIYARAPLGQEDPAAHDISWQTPLGSVETHKLTISEIPLPASQCIDETVGAILTWNGAEIYRDTKISASRGCPIGYTLERIYVADYTLPDFAVALIGVWTNGFEGQDLRHIALPIPLSAVE